MMLRLTVSYSHVRALSYGRPRRKAHATTLT